MTTYYVIPARKGSKGFPNKNRKLFLNTFSKIPKKLHKNVILTSNDAKIIDFVKDTTVKVIQRSEELSRDKVSVKTVLQDVVKKRHLNDDDIIVLLYLTYPDRKWKDVIDYESFMLELGGKSLLCGQEVKSNPYLCMYNYGFKGKQIIKHDLYRRQDYPPVFELSHYISVIKVSELNKLNYNLYNDETLYYHRDRVRDIDYESDLLTE